MPENRTYPAIVVITYNRPNSLKRLLQSLHQSGYPGKDIPLVISIEGGAPQKLIAIAEAFTWTNGPKKVILQDSKLGIKDHMHFAGWLSREYGTVIILEDDLFLSPHFYSFACQAAGYYSSEPKVAAVALYSYRVAESCFRFFSPLDDEYDTFFMQVPCSWGSVFTHNQWQEFIDWERDSRFSENLLPKYVERWPDSSWKKAFFAYLIQQDKYFIYPKVSLSTNFADPGTHFPSSSGLFQVPLQVNNRTYKFVPFETSTNVYDAHFEMTTTCYNRHFNGGEETIDLDLYGTKSPGALKGDLVITSKKTTTSIKAYSTHLSPLLINIIEGLEGKDLKLIPTKDLDPNVGEADLAKAVFAFEYLSQPPGISQWLFRFLKKWQLYWQLLILKFQNDK